MDRLAWITDDDLNAAVATLLRSATSSRTKSEQRQQRNVVDPFLSLLIASTFSVQQETTLRSLQNLSSALRGMSNALGRFHQDVLGGVSGWVNHDAGYDLECTDRKLLAEVKNKHNTMNASNREKVISDLDTAVRQKGQGWTAYLVIIVPKKPERFKHHHGNRAVYEIDGASFYELVTGEANALHDLFEALCENLPISEEVGAYCLQVMQSSIPPPITPESR